MLRLKPHAGYAVGVKLMEKRIVCAVTNFAAGILFHNNYFLNQEPFPAVTAETVAYIVERVLTEASIKRSQVFGVGIGLAGVIHPQHGMVRYSPFFGWRDGPLAQQVQNHLNLPMYVENDVNTLTLSEHLFGSGRHHDNFVVVTVVRGIGMGMVINGQLYQGSRGGAGELGHIILNLPLARESGVDNGSLEGLAADPAVIREAHMTLGASLNDVVQAATAGDVEASAALAQSGEFPGSGLATIINILCPPLITISGKGVVVGDYRLQPMFEAMRRYTFNGLIDDVEVIVEPTDDQAWA